MPRLYRKASAARPAPITERLRGRWLRSRLAPARVCLFARLGSTNLTARRLLEAGVVQAPALICAARQTAGRGQRTNRWWSDAGSLCATFLLPAAEGIPIGQVPLRAGLAVAKVVARHLPGLAVQVKWPNDVLVDGRKIAGLLCARLGGADLIGVGLNVGTDLTRAPAEVRRRATSLRREAGRAPRRDEVLAEIWAVMAGVMAEVDWHRAYEARHVLQDCLVRVDDEGVILAGRCRGVDGDGRLLLERADGMVAALTAGTVLDWQ